MGRGLLVLIVTWIFLFLREYLGNMKVLDRIYKMVGKRVFCFLGEVYYFKKWSVKEELMFSGYKVLVL